MSIITRWERLPREIVFKVVNLCMRLRSGKIIHMVDELSNVNGGSSTNDSIPVSMQQADVSSRSEGAIGTKNERHNARENNEGVENIFQNENNILNRENPYVVPRGQNADDLLARLHGFYMRKKLLNVHIPDLAHLVEKVRQTELMKKEKEKYKNEQRSKSKPFTRKENIAYVTMESSEEDFDFKTEVDLAELKKGPPYSHVRSVYPRTGDDLLDFLVQQKIKDRDAIGAQWIRNCQDFQRRDHLYRHNPQWGHQAPFRNQYAYYRGRARGYPRGRGGRRSFNQNKKLQLEAGKEVSKGVTPSVHSRIVFPSDGKTYPKEITSPEKMEKGKAVAQSSGMIKIKMSMLIKRDDDMIGTISIIPTEYLEKCESNPDEDYDQEDEEAFSFIRIEDEPGVLPVLGKLFGKASLPRIGLRADWLGLSFLKTLKTALWTRLRKFPTTW
ncbi:hypothetical protein Ahy_B05g079013 [Arachis hypogaea]|uniref:Uncharacterized protein n=1 Tax=Arachis hypogaea TaxID=3818 RepID=A0A444Z8Y4_ARAHY|nr:hypothetical protein Ahy_B05g079013 [Arachis hypogaea]